MTDTPDPAAPGPAARSDFDWQIDLLWEVLGAAVSPKECTNALLGLKSQAGITQRRNGTLPLLPVEANRIVMGYDLHQHRLDGSLFEIRNEAAFRETLLRHGVGVHGNTPRAQLIARLDQARVRDGLSVTLRNGRAPRAVIYDDDPDEPLRVFISGQRVWAVIQGRPGRHTALLQLRHGNADLIDILSPTAKLLDSLLEPHSQPPGRLVVPSFESEGLKISRDTSEFRLLAIEGEEALIDLFAVGDEERENAPGVTAWPMLGAPRLSSTHATLILEWLSAHPKAPLRCAEFRFFVSPA